MTITAHSGALLTFPSGVNSGEPAGQNPEAGPVLGHHGQGLLDARPQFTYQPGQDFGKKTYFFPSNSCCCLDQAPSAISATNIAAGQSVTAATPMTLVSSTGAGITVGVSITNAATGKAVTVLAIDGAMGSVAYGSAATLQAWDATKAISRTVRITTNADDTAGFYLVSGYDIYGFPMSQLVTGVNNAVCTTTKAFKYIASVLPSGTLNSTSVSVGTGDVFGFPLRVDRLPYLNNAWWGNPQAVIVGGSVAQQTTMEIPITLANLANAQVYQVDVPFDGKLISMAYRAIVATTTGSKAATLTAQANASSVTGGVVALSGTYAIGAAQAGTAITGANTFTAGQTIGFVVSSVTTFIEGSGVIELVVQNTDDTGGTFTGAVTTTATTTTGDVRGTFAVPSASDGTKRLTIFIALNPTNASTTAGMWGVTQV